MTARTGARAEGEGDSGLLLELVVSGDRRPTRRDREAREEASRRWGRGRGGRGVREEIEGRWGSSEEMWRRWEEGEGRRDREEWGSIRGGSSDGFWRREGRRRSGRWGSGEGSIGLGLERGLGGLGLRGK